MEPWHLAWIAMMPISQCFSKMSGKQNNESLRKKKSLLPFYKKHDYAEIERTKE